VVVNCTISNTETISTIDGHKRSIIAGSHVQGYYITALLILTVSCSESNKQVVTACFLQCIAKVYSLTCHKHIVCILKLTLSLWCGTDLSLQYFHGKSVQLHMVSTTFILTAYMTWK